MSKLFATSPDAEIARNGRGCIVVVPCYNEAERLQPQRFAEYLEQEEGIRFLFVNDGSTDETVAILRQMHQQRPGSIDWLDKQPNGGKAEAVRVGLLKALDEHDAEYVGFWDADLATPLEAIRELLAKLEQTPGLEMVFGARVRLLGRAIHRQPARHYLGRCFATVASLLLKLPIYDTQCGAKLFRVTPELRQVLAEPFLSSWIFDVEILARFVRLNRQTPDRLHEMIFEYPLHRWEDVAGSRVKTKDFVRAVGELVRIRQTYLR